ncbi:T9SS sorting signal type C domain-containing protein [Flavobacterium sp. LaA7.5]|nr:T9SS sorting signal type C domain-containing protein [Flavobacterium salilacus subsp. altitudinum]
MSILLLATCNLWAQGYETFNNIPANTSGYDIRSWTGDNNVSWQATDARTDQSLTGRAICIRDSGHLINTSTISGGVGTISFNYKRVFSNNSILRVYVNDVQYGGDITVSSTNTSAFSTAVNVAGDVVIRIENITQSSDRRTIIDDLEWTTGLAAPTVTTTQILDADITSTSAISGGNVTSTGGASTVRGVVWNTSANPTVSLSTKTSDGTSTATGSYTSTLSSLSSNTQYYYRAYATNGGGTAYGTQYSFYTAAITPGAPVLGNPFIDSFEITLNGNGNNSAVEYAIRVNSSQYIDASGELTDSEVWQTAAAWGTITVTGLDADTTYSVDVKARNTSGLETPFSSTAEITTLSASAPFITLDSASLDFGDVCTNATGNGSFTFTGENIDAGSDVDVAALAGYSYSLTEGGTYEDNLTITNYNNETVTVYVQFSPGSVTNYNGNIIVSGTGSGDPAELSVAVTGEGINTPGNAVTGTTSSITQVSAVTAGQAITGGCTAISAYGVEYSTTDGFTPGTGIQVAGSNLSGTDFSVTLTSLLPQETYYYVAYITDGSGTIYGTQSTFSTLSLQAPVATDATTVESLSFTANWEAVTGADGYYIEVSEYEDFGTGIAATDLFFSEYIEGNSFNKYLEIYNGTGVAVDLSDYQIRVYFNGDGLNNYVHQTLSGTLNNGETVVIRNTSGTLYYDAIEGGVIMNFNGDDAVTLYKISTGSFVDIIGSIGYDPGTSWSAGGNLETVNKTLVRNSNVLGGVTINPDTGGAAFGNPAVGFPTLATEWTGYSIDTQQLGNHTFDGTFTPSFVEGYENLDAGNVTSYEITGLEQGVTYYYRVRARNAESNAISGNSNTIEVTTTITLPYLEATTLEDFGSVCINTTTTNENYFTVTGLNLDEDVVVGPLTGYTFSATSDGTYTETLTFTPEGDETLSADVYVRFTPVDEISYNGNIPVTGGGTDDSLTVAVTGEGINTPATVTTANASSIDVFTATLGGNVTDEGCSAVTERGVVYGTSSTPAIGGVGVIQQAATETGAGAYTVAITDLEPSTLYYVRAYTTNNAGTVYGSEVSFTTLDYTLEAPVATDATGIESDSFTANWDAVAEATGYYLDVSTSPDFIPETAGSTNTETFSNMGTPASADITRTWTGDNGIAWEATDARTDRSINSSSAISFREGHLINTTPIPGGLSAVSFYYQKVFSSGESTMQVLINGTQYGGDIAVVNPTTTVHEFSIDNLNIEGNITIEIVNSGGGRVAIDNLTIVGISSESTFVEGYEDLDVGNVTSYEVTGLEQGVTYYYRVRAENIDYNAVSPNSNTIEVTTAIVLPYLEATTLEDFGSVCINTTTTIENYFTITGLNLNEDVVVGPLTGYTFAVTPTGTYAESLTFTPESDESLSANIYIRFAPIDEISYNGEIPVTGGGTDDSLTVAVTGEGINTSGTAVTGVASNITQVSATIAGQGAESCTTITAYGIEYSITDGFTVGEGTQIEGNNLTDSDFSVALSSLGAGTTYYYRAYITDGSGTVYGDQASFTTTDLNAPVTTEATTVLSDSFVANWTAVAGAEGYYLDVSTSSEFTPEITGSTNAETFSNVSTADGGGVSASTYATRVWTGDNGISWEATDARIDQDINGDAISFRVGHLTNTTTISGGLVSLSFNYKRVFSGNSTLQVFINGTQYGENIIVSDANPNPFNITGLNIPGDITIELVNSGNRIVVDDLTVVGISSESTFVTGYENLDVGNVTSYTVTGVEELTTYYYRVRAYSTNSTSVNSNTTAVTTKPASIVWNGTQWTPSQYPDTTPVVIDTTIDAFIEGDYNTATDGSFEVKTLTVNSGLVVVAEGTSITVADEIVNNNGAENFIVENNANVIQLNEATNVGEITVQKLSSPLYRLDYTLWSSPVRGQNLQGFSPETLANRFYDYNEATDLFGAIDPEMNDFEEGLGYLIRMPNDHPAFVDSGTPGTAWMGTFVGVPYNGTVTVPMETAFNGYNLVGNPYPSPINIHDFYEANTGILNGSSALYFWRKRNDPDATTYATVTMAAYTANNQTGGWGDTGSGTFVGDPSDWVINPGQGFFVQASGGVLTFNNTMRADVNNGQFFRMSPQDNELDISRWWLNLTGNSGEFSQMAVAYSDVTTDGLDYGWDGKALTNDGLVKVYSTLQENRLAIQARASFADTDAVTLGYSVTEAGSYTLSLDHTDGLFLEGQDIFLTDNVAEETVNLGYIDYVFASEAGTFEDRFVITYRLAPLSNPEFELNNTNVMVFAKDEVITVTSGNLEMADINIYDVRGRLLFTQSGINASEVVIDSLQSQQQMLIVKVTTDKGTVSKKIVF